MCFMCVHVYMQDIAHVQYVMFGHLIDWFPSSWLSLHIDSTIVCIDVGYMFW